MLKLDTTVKIVARLVTSPAVNQCFQPEEFRPFKPGQGQNHRTNKVTCEHDAEQLFRWIMGNLPSGTYDRLIAKLLEWEVKSGYERDDSHSRIRACLAVFQGRFTEPPHLGPLS